MSLSVGFQLADFNWFPVDNFDSTKPSQLLRTFHVVISFLEKRFPKFRILWKDMLLLVKTRPTTWSDSKTGPLGELSKTTGGNSPLSDIRLSGSSHGPRNLIMLRITLSQNRYTAHCDRYSAVWCQQAVTKCSGVIRAWPADTVLQSTGPSEQCTGFVTPWSGVWLDCADHIGIWWVSNFVFNSFSAWCGHGLMRNDLVAVDVNTVHQPFSRLHWHFVCCG